MKKLAAVALAVIVCATTGCLQWGKTAGSVSLADSGAPERDTNIQELIDDTKNGGVVRIPRGRYILKKGLVVKGRKDLTIRCEEGAQILVDDVNEDVITLDKCSNIRIENAYLRHVEPLTKYACHGSVIRVWHSNNIAIINCELNGCGSIGLAASDTSELTVRNCYVHHNTFKAFGLYGCKGVRIQSCVVEDNASFLQSSGLDDVELSDNIIRRNGGYWRKKDPSPGLRIGEARRK